MSNINTLVSRLERSQMPFGFWVLGNFGIAKSSRIGAEMSQMPFGFWVLGNNTKPG